MEDIRECIKCTKKEDKEIMCLGIDDIMEDYVSEKTIDNFEKVFLKGMSIENYFCGTCANQSLKIMEQSQQQKDKYEFSQLVKKRSKNLG